MNKYQEALDYAKKHLDSQLDLEKIEVLQELIDKATQKENTLEFKNFRLNADRTLKRMSKDELTSYIHILHNNWGICDKQLQNVMDYAKKLQDETDKYKHEYFAMCDLIENPQPYKFEDLHKGMWVWDDKSKCCFKCNPAISTDMAQCVTYNAFWYNCGEDEDEFFEEYDEFEEGRFFPVTKAMEY